MKGESFGPTATLIPNNKIRFSTIKPDILRVGEEVAREYGGLAKVAYDLI